MSLKITIDSGGVSLSVESEEESKSSALLSAYAGAIGVPESASTEERVQAVLESLVGYMTERAQRYVIRQANDEAEVAAQAITFGARRKGEDDGSKVDTGA